jgi:methylthioribose-1-phosphate isomerase
MRQGKVDLVIVGADRVAMNADVANQIGTYEKAVLARENGIPFYVATPFSTFDREAKTGDDIPIEYRGSEDVLVARGLSTRGCIEEVTVPPVGSCAENPVFDVTPAEYITGIITPLGTIRADAEGISEKLRESGSSNSGS